MSTQTSFCSSRPAHSTQVNSCLVVIKKPLLQSFAESASHMSSHLLLHTNTPTHISSFSTRLSTPHFHHSQAIGPSGRAAGPSSDPREPQGPHGGRHVPHPDRARHQSHSPTDCADQERECDAELHGASHPGDCSCCLFGKCCSFVDLCECFNLLVLFHVITSSFCFLLRILLILIWYIIILSDEPHGGEHWCTPAAHRDRASNGGNLVRRGRKAGRERGDYRRVRQDARGRSAAQHGYAEVYYLRLRCIWLFNEGIFSSPRRLFVR